MYLYLKYQNSRHGFRKEKNVYRWKTAHPASGSGIQVNAKFIPTLTALCGLPQTGWKLIHCSTYVLRSPYSCFKSEYENLTNINSL